MTGRQTTASASGQGASPTDAVRPAETPGRTVYICPMPEHVAIEYQQPGSCSLCGMTLVPVSPDTLRKIQPGGPVEFYTCPMPEHSDVHLDQPGKCPRCRMTLIPVMPQPSMAIPEPTADAVPELYTCPMASHAHIVSDQPGLCPECEMKLVPVQTVDHGGTSTKVWQERQDDSP